MMRWFAFLDICDDSRIERFTRHSDDGRVDEMRTEVVAVAATMPLGRRGAQ